MARNRSNPKLSVVWLEGVLDYFNVPFPHEPEDPREIGFGVGKQIVGLYLIEMILKYALDDAGKPYDRSHSLRDLFLILPSERRSAVEDKYSQILSNGVSETWDFASSVESFLEYLGDDPLTDSRYFWERERPHNMSIVFFRHNLSLLIYALFIALHNYPEGSALKKQYETKFISFEESLKEQEEPLEAPNMERADKRITLTVFWLEGLLDYFNVEFPQKPGDPRRVGFQLGQRMVGLYLAEMLLKYAADDLNRQYGSSHNLYSLFKKLPRPRRRAVAKKYDSILHNRVSSTWDHARTLESHLEYLGDDPLTETRYFWEWSDKPILLSPDPLVPLIYSLFIELHQYPQSGPIRKRYETAFIPFEGSLRKRKWSGAGG